jgi:hypothetical protein
VERLCSIPQLQVKEVFGSLRKLPKEFERELEFAPFHCCLALFDFDDTGTETFMVPMFKGIQERFSSTPVQVYR